jgi:hypothetical protein
VVSYGPSIELPNMKTTALCKLGAEHIALDDTRNTAGIYSLDTFDMIARLTSKKDPNENYLCAAIQVGNRSFFSYSGGKLVVTGEPSMDIQEEISAEYKLSSTITSFLTFNPDNFSQFLLCPAENGSLLYFNLSAEKLKIPARIAFPGLKDIY